MKLQLDIVDSLPLLVGVVTHAAWSVAIRIDWMRWWPRPTDVGWFCLQRSAFDRPDEIEEGLMVGRVESRSICNIGNLKFESYKFDN